MSFLPTPTLLRIGVLPVSCSEYLQHTSHNFTCLFVFLYLCPHLFRHRLYPDPLSYVLQYSPVWGSGPSPPLTFMTPSSYTTGSH